MHKIINITTIADELAIAWSDGEESYISFEKLRRVCPCAHCQGEPDAMGRLVKPEVILTDRSFVLLKYEEVGGYCLKLTWGDGHNTGLYSFDLLRAVA